MEGNIMEHRGSTDFPPLSDLTSIRSFVLNELSRSSPRLALISCLLGEAEEKKLQFPLSEYGIVYLRLLDFIQSMKFDLDAPRPELMKNIAKAAWYATSNSIPSRRSFAQKHAHVYHYVVKQKCNCLCFSTVFLEICRYFGIQSVKVFLSEVHVWIGYRDEGNVEPCSCSVGDYSTVEIMTPDKEVGCPVNERLSYSWGYGRNVAGDWKCHVCDDHTFVGALLSNTNLGDDSKVKMVSSSLRIAHKRKRDSELHADFPNDEHFLIESKVRLLLSLFEELKLIDLPFALSELGDLLMEIDVSSVAEMFYRVAVKSSQLGYDDHLYGPYASLGSFFEEKFRWSEVLLAYVGVSRVLSHFRYVTWDEEVLKEVQRDLLPPLVKHLKVACERELPRPEDQLEREEIAASSLTELSSWFRSNFDFPCNERALDASVLFSSPRNSLFVQLESPMHCSGEPLFAKRILFILDSLFLWFEQSEGIASLSVPSIWQDLLIKSLGIVDRSAWVLAACESTVLFSSRLMVSGLSEILSNPDLSGRQLRERIRVLFDSGPISLGHSKKRVHL